jgi:hypothetical protein
VPSTTRSCKACCHNAKQGVGGGRVFGINESLDALGATIGPLVIAVLIASGCRLGATDRFQQVRHRLTTASGLSWRKANPHISTKALAHDGACVGSWRRPEECLEVTVFLKGQIPSKAWEVFHECLCVLPSTRIQFREISSRWLTSCRSAANLHRRRGGHAQHMLAAALRNAAVPVQPRTLRRWLRSLDEPE